LHATSGSLAHDATITLSINPPAQTSETGTLLYLQTYSSGHTPRIGLETAWGGSIVEVSLDGTNFVNAHDTGREVQPALYDGAAHYDGCAGCTGVFGWDPVLGGDRYDHGSPVLTQQVDTSSLYVKAQPLQWHPDDKGGGANTPVLSDMYFEQSVDNMGINADNCRTQAFSDKASCRATDVRSSQSPVPAREIVWGEPVALSVKLREAPRAPVEIGLKTIETEQLAPGDKVLAQLLV